jgi:Fe-S-cluster containining protein
MVQASIGREDPRQERFGYVCNRCLRCCHHKKIQLNPYEVARLAQSRGMSTTAFRRDYTDGGAGVVLAQTDNGACVFLGPEGCGVHPDRPLVCRLYPLGRHVFSDGDERYSHVAPHPQSEGVFTDDGTIADFLEAQGAAPFIQAADAYLAWLSKALNTVPEAPGQVGLASNPAADPEAPDEAFDLLDMDAALAAHGPLPSGPSADGVETRTRLHLEILYAQLAEQEGRE